jgi:hypothetical protein
MAATSSVGCAPARHLASWPEVYLFIYLYFGMIDTAVVVLLGRSWSLTEDVPPLP